MNARKGSEEAHRTGHVSRWGALDRHGGTSYDARLAVWTRPLLVVMAFMCVTAHSATTRAQSPATQAATLHVTENAGVRRFNYPVHARVPFERGALRDVAHVRLLRADEEVAAQVGAESRWPDGSVQWLTVYFNASIGPSTTETYRVEYGDDVMAEAQTGRGLVLREDADAVQVGNLRFSKSGTPLLLSVKYREEVIGLGANGIVVTDETGARSDLAGVDTVEFEVVQRGPLYVEFRYSGHLVFATGDSFPFVMVVGTPNSKSWVKLSATVDDPNSRLRDLSLHLPFLLGDLPWVWDFGTDYWTYGALRAQDDSVVLTNVVSPPDHSSWRVDLRRSGRDQVYETGDQAVAGWGHIQGSEEVVAFAMDGFGSQAGTYRMSIDGAGHTSFGFSPATPIRQHRLTVYTHFVSTPVQIGAATSPTSMLHPLVAVCELERYTASGLPAPPSR